MQTPATYTKVGSTQVEHVTASKQVLQTGIQAVQVNPDKKYPFKHAIHVVAVSQFKHPLIQPTHTIGIGITSNI